MTHRPATIVIPVWNQWAATRACLASLRPTLGVHDQVVVVDNGSQDETAAGLGATTWLTVVTNDQNRGFATACNQGAAEARNDVVVFLNNDTLVPSRWMEGLLAPFDDPSVFATGPRSNFVSGPQLVSGATYDPGRMAELQRFARQWRHDHRGEVSEVSRLVGFCLAVRLAAFRQVGGFDEEFEVGGYEDDDLCTRLQGSGGRLLITHESFVHHDGHRTFDGNGVDWRAQELENRQRYLAKHVPSQRSAPAPLLSACLIVRDEEAVLGESLAALTEVVDEIVVYDTGSVDRTKDIAREHGALVVDGYWDDDFARARNDALAGCSGTWILHVDADEVLQGDGEALRRELARDGAVDSYTVRIDNLDGAGREVSFSHRATRLFRRERARWLGRLHEQVGRRPGQPPLRGAETELVSIRHSGYRTSVMDSKQKLSRNVAIAQAEVDSGTGHRALALNSLARALAAAGRVEEAVTRFEQARTAARGAEGLTRITLRHGAEALLAVGRLTEAREWVAELRTLPGSGTMAGYLEALLLLGEGEHDLALARLEHLQRVSDGDGFVVPDSTVRLYRGVGLFASRRWGAAADELRPLVQHGDGALPVWAMLADAVTLAGGDVAELVAVVPDDRLVAVLGQLLNARPQTADGMAEALWQSRPGDTRLLAFAARLGPSLEVPRMLEWSARLRSHHHADRCPLAVVAADPDAPALRRVQSGCVAAATFGDGGAAAAAVAAAAGIEPDTVRAMLADVSSLSPELLPRVLEAAANGPERCLALAQALYDFGAAEQAWAVFDHGWRRPDGVDATLAREAAAWLRGCGQAARAELLPV